MWCRYFGCEKTKIQTPAKTHGETCSQDVVLDPFWADRVVDPVEAAWGATSALEKHVFLKEKLQVCVETKQFLLDK